MSDILNDKIRRVREMRYEFESQDLSELSEGLSESSEFKELCLSIAEEAVEREVQADAIEARIKEMTERKNRLLRTSDTLRAIVLQCMEIRGEKTITSPTLTLSVATRKPTVIITDEALLPSKFFIPQPPKVDKKAVNDAVLNDGEIIEGATLNNGSVNLTIRRK